MSNFRRAVAGHCVTDERRRQPVFALAAGAAALLAFARWTCSLSDFQIPSGLDVEVAKVSRHVLLGVDPVCDINDIAERRNLRSCPDVVENHVSAGFVDVLKVQTQDADICQCRNAYNVFVITDSKIAQIE